jgi:hypothetical protein
MEHRVSFSGTRRLIDLMIVSIEQEKLALPLPYHTFTSFFWPAFSAFVLLRIFFNIPFPLFQPIPRAPRWQPRSHHVLSGTNYAFMRSKPIIISFVFQNLANHPTSIVHLSSGRRLGSRNHLLRPFHTVLASRSSGLNVVVAASFGHWASPASYGGSKKLKTCGFLYPAQLLDCSVAAFSFLFSTIFLSFLRMFKPC